MDNIRSVAGVLTTKSELISMYLTEDLIRKSWSCYSSRGRRMMCGFCWNCFITKMSAIASGISLESLNYANDPLTDVLPRRYYLENQNILYNLLVFYEKVINENFSVIKELSRYNGFFEEKLATNFGLDLFLGISRSLSYTSKRSGLGKKAESILSKIDNSRLKDREEHLLSLRARKKTTKPLSILFGV